LKIKRHDGKVGFEAFQPPKEKAPWRAPTG